MKNIHVSTQNALSRRHFLRGAGVLLGLPLLDAMLPAFAHAGSVSTAPRRFLGICNNLGVLPDKFFPAVGTSPTAGSQSGPGRDYKIGRAHV